ncbi:MAG: FHA domain-containing protein [Myxococcota bacterium]
MTLKTVDELRRMTAFPPDAMLQQVGPLALIQRGGGAATPAAPTPLPFHEVMTRTVEIEAPPVARQALGLMLKLHDGVVVPLGAEAPDGQVVFGRADDVDVRLVDPSVSGRHAVVRFDAWKRAAWVKDLGSTNGTLVNGAPVTAETALAEGNVVTLGDASAFLFLRTETLYALLKQR